MLRSKLVGAIAIAASLAGSAISAVPAAQLIPANSATVLSLVPGKARAHTVAVKKNNVLGLPLLALLAIGAVATTAVVVAASSGSDSP